ncbi:MAG: prepilin peptidase [Oribacterium sp.]|nr:prepilin peptidase [Oribacterium sp.]
MDHTSIGFTIYILTLAFVFGTVLGSFIDCMAWRIVKQESVLNGRSHCDVCGTQLTAGDLIPIVSYLKSGGKCSHCGAKISPESTWVEFLLGLTFAVLVLKFDLSFIALRFMGLSVILMGLSLVDLKTFIIPDRFHVMGIIWWLMTLPLTALTKGQGLTSYFAREVLGAEGTSLQTGTESLSALELMLQDLKFGLISAFGIALFMLILSIIFDKVSGKESLGGGDIKLLFMTGLYMRPGVAVFNLILSCIVGLVFVFILKKEKIPFGPSISLATMISILIGSEFVDWYIGLLF